MSQNICNFEHSIRTIKAGPFCITLLPRCSYEVSYRPDKSAIGFAFESQSGVHAFASDRVTPFRTKPNSLAFVPQGCEVFSSSKNGGEYLLVVDEADLLTEGETPRHFNNIIDQAAIAAAQRIRSALLGSTRETLLVEENAGVLFDRTRKELNASSKEVREARWMTPARLKLIDEFIDSQISQELRVAEIAAVLGLSEGFFIRAFKASIGKSPHSYLIDRRLAHARVLLRTSAHNLGDVALTVGFSSHAHMTAAFTHRLGVTPGRLRATMGSRSDLSIKTTGQ